MKIQVGGRLLKIRKRGCRAPLRLSKFVRRLLCFLRPRISRSRSPALICAEGKRTRPSSFPADCEISMEESVVRVKGMGRRRKLVPEGFVAVCVGEDLQRFVILIVYFSHPFFRKLLGEAEEIFGYPRDGPLAVPCDVDDFEQLKWLVDRETVKSSGGHRPRHVGLWERPVG